MHTYVLVTTTHLGLPLPPTIDWLPKLHPPAGPVPLSTHPLLAQCHFLSHSPSISIDFTPNLAVCLPVYLPTHPHLSTLICLAANPSTPIPHSACLGLEPTPIHPPTPSGFHPHLSVFHPPNPPRFCALFCQSIHLSAYLGLVPSPSIVTTGWLSHLLKTLYIYFKKKKFFFLEGGDRYILWITHPTCYITPLDNHCQPWHHQPGPLIHISVGCKAIPIGLIAKPIWLTLPMLPKVAHGGLKFFWWYDKISYAPALSTVRPFCRQAKSDFHWPIRPLPCWWSGRWVIWSGMGSGVMSTCVEVLGRILGNDLFLFFFSLSWNHLLFYVLYWCLLVRFFF